MRRGWQWSLVVWLAGGIAVCLAQPAAEKNLGRGGLPRLPSSPLLMALDANGDGEISFDELKGAELKLKKLDVNEDGVISPEELRPSGSGLSGAPSAASGNSGGPFGGGNPSEGLVGMLMGFDKNKDGKVTKEEAPERLHGLLERTDVDGDGAITKIEIEKSLSAGITSGRPSGREVGFAGARPMGELGPSGRPRDLGVPSNLVVMMAKRAFEQQDINQDGKLGAEELTGAMKENLERIDTNANGSIELKELESLARVFEVGSGAADGEREERRPAGRPGGR